MVSSRVLTTAVSSPDSLPTTASFHAAFILLIKVT